MTFSATPRMPPTTLYLCRSKVAFSFSLQNPHLWQPFICKIPFACKWQNAIFRARVF